MCLSNVFVRNCIHKVKSCICRSNPNSKVVTKLVKSIMLDGKKGVAQKIVYGAFATVEEKTGRPALEVFEEAMNNVMPAL